MRIWHRFIGGFRALLRRRRTDMELDAELRAFLAESVDSKVRGGMSRAAAERAARLELGSVAAVADRVRDVGWDTWVDSLRIDVRYGLRGLRRSPGFTSVALLTLGVGIGANTAIFSIIYAVLLNPLPFRDATRLVRVYTNTSPQDRSRGVPPRINAIEARDFVTLRDHATGLTHIASMGTATVIADIDGSPVQLTGSAVSAALFQMLEVKPLLGRWLSLDDERTGADRTILISYAMWQAYYAADVSALGRRVAFIGRPAGPLGGTTPLAAYTIVGVMPPSFHFPDGGTQFWIARGVSPAPDGRPRLVSALARVADDMSIDAATSQVNALLRESLTVAPAVDLVPIATEVGSSVRSALLVFFAAAGCVLLIACANVASLVLARTQSRAQEFAMRIALGAQRGRLLRQLLAESLLLAGAGGACGLAVAVSCIRLFRVVAANMPRRDLGADVTFPRLSAIGIDGHALAFAMGVSIVAGVLVWVAPALGRLDIGLLESMKAVRPSRLGGTARWVTPRSVLVTLEIAMAVLLVVSSGLLIRSFLNLEDVRLGYVPDHVLTFQVNPAGDRHPPADLVVFADRLVERLRAVPGVEFAAYGNQLPTVNLRDTAGGLWTTPDAARPLSPIGADARVVSVDYIHAMGIRVLAGRTFDQRDTATAPGAVLINESLARTTFGGVIQAVGRVAYVGRNPRPWMVTGVVEDVRQFGLDHEPEPQFFVDFRQAHGALLPSDGSTMAFAGMPILPAGAYYVVRSNGEPTGLVSSVREAARVLDPLATVDNIATMDAIVSNALTRPRLYAVLAGAFTGIAVALAAIGIYGMMAYTVVRRTREIGIRIALGADRARILAMVLGESTLIALIGTALGLGGAAVTTRYLQILLFGLTPLDATAFGSAGILFMAVAVLASYLPARRATAVDPLIAIRSE